MADDKPKVIQETGNVELLERELSFMQLQVNRLLEITKAISANYSAESLFALYRDNLSWILSIRKMALFMHMENGWVCPTSIGVEDASTLEIEDASIFSEYTRPSNITKSDNPILSEFEIIIPITHKDNYLAYTLIGGLSSNDQAYEKIQYITTLTNIITVAIENKRLFKRQLEQERLNRDMELAVDVQKMLIPLKLPKTSVYELDSIYVPLVGIGGDYYDFVPLGENKFAMCIADISGKGIGAALLMANFQANFRTLVLNITDPAEFILELNRAVFRSTRGDKFITFFFATYDHDTKKLKYICAGHNPPIAFMGGAVKQLDVGCTILGQFEEIKELEVGGLDVTDDLILTMYTDGLTDVKNEKEEFFEPELIEKFAEDHAHLSAFDYNATLMESLVTFKGEMDFLDDIAVLTCKITPHD